MYNDFKDIRKQIEQYDKEFRKLEKEKSNCRDKNELKRIEKRLWEVGYISYKLGKDIEEMEKIESEIRYLEGKVCYENNRYIK